MRLSIVRRPVLRWRIVFALAVLPVLLWAAGSAILSEGSMRPARVKTELSTATWQYLNSLAASWESPRIASFDGTTLSAWFLRPKTAARGCVVLLHGIADSRRGAVGPAGFLLEAGYAVLLPDLRAHGESGGELLTYGVLESHDVLAWINWTKAAGCSQHYGLGESLGGAVLIQAAARYDVFTSLVAECSFSSLREVAVERVREKTPVGASLLVPGALLYARLRYGLDLFGVSPEHDVTMLKAPLLLIHGLADERTSPAHSVRIFRAARGRAVELWQVEGAGHTGTFAAAPVEFRQRVLKWFSAIR